MDKTYIDKNHIVDRYLLGQLSEDEASAFETYYFEHPKMLEELTIAKAMQETLREERGLLSELETNVAAATWLERLFPPKLGFAFSAILSIGIVGLLIQNNALKSGTDNAYPITSLSLSTTRGGTADMPSLRIVDDQPAALFHLELGQIGYSEVILRLQEETGRVVWEGRTTVAGPIGAVDLVVSAESLTPAVYELAVFPPQGGVSPLSTYAFQVE